MPRVLLGVATFGITLEQRKDYRARWKFHIDRKNKYEGIIDRIDLVDTWSDVGKQAKVRELAEDFTKLRDSEPDIVAAGQPLGKTGKRRGSH